MNKVLFYVVAVLLRLILFFIAIPLTTCVSMFALIFTGKFYDTPIETVFEWIEKLEVR